MGAGAPARPADPVDLTLATRYSEGRGALFRIAGHVKQAAKEGTGVQPRSPLGIGVFCCAEVKDERAGITGLEAAHHHGA